MRGIHLRRSVASAEYWVQAIANRRPCLALPHIRSKGWWAGSAGRAYGEAEGRCSGMEDTHLSWP